MDKKSKKKIVVQPVVSVPVVTPPVVKSDSEKIWDEIKNVRLEIFALPNQFVHTYYKPMIIDPVKLHLTGLTKASSVLPALESALYPKYLIEQIDRFIVITLAPAQIKK